jgi:hypothetical protein
MIKGKIIAGKFAGNARPKVYLVTMPPVFIPQYQFPVKN